MAARSLAGGDGSPDGAARGAAGRPRSLAGGHGLRRGGVGSRRGAASAAMTTVRPAPAAPLAATRRGSPTPHTHSGGRSMSACAVSNVKSEDSVQSVRERGPEYCRVVVTYSLPEAEPSHDTHAHASPHPSAAAASAAACGARRAGGGRRARTAPVASSSVAAALAAPVAGASEATAPSSRSASRRGRAWRRQRWSTSGTARRPNESAPAAAARRWWCPRRVHELDGVGGAAVKAATAAASA